MELNFCVCGIRIYFNMNSQENGKVIYSSQETYNFQVLGNENLIIASYKAIKISLFYQLAVKFWLREDDDLQK